MAKKSDRRNCMNRFSKFNSNMFDNFLQSIHLTDCLDIAPPSFLYIPSVRWYRYQGLISISQG